MTTSSDRESVIVAVAEMRAAVDRLEAALGLQPSAADATPARTKPLRRFGRLTRIERDPKLRAFVDARIGTMSQTDLVAACRAAFGPKRAPSLSGLNRYIHIAAAEARSGDQVEAK